jgi:RHS repeat-associated protein
MPWNPALHTHTPVLAVIEPRGLLARSVSFHRAEIPETLAERIDRTVYDAAARPVGRWDARLWAAAEQVSDAPRNLSYLYSLSGRPLFCDSADAGWSASLEGEAGQAMYRWNARGHSQRVEHDGWLRPVALFESDGSHEGCVERFVYGAVDAAARNQCGRMIRHDDPAGVALNSGFDISGALVEQTRRFLNAVNSSDWPQSIDERDALLETGLGLTTGWRYNPLGELLEQIDCQLNVRRFSQTVSGVLKSAALQLKDQSEQVLVDGIRYNAQGQIESEIAGNGVVTTALYRPQDGRLIRLKAQRDDGHVLQDLHYEYDPVGNVTCLDDSAQVTRFFANQRIEPVSTYRYDTLYQLIEATGRETASVNHGPALPGFQSPADLSKLTNYTQTFDYDAGGNLLKLSHVGAQNHSLSMVSARHSNRCLPVLNDVPPSEADIAAAFDASGNLHALQPGQTLTWDRRNQLQQVRPVVRESGPDDSESYVYDGKGQRVRKVTTKLAASVTHTAEVRYLPCVEIRTNTATGETLHVVTVQAGRNSVRVLHWQQGKPEGIGNDQSRYGLSDHLGSCALELDQQAQTISQESYYPFGGTSWWAGRNEIEARYKTVRYSGKERDATGLYYYGLRYYAPWLMRWINPDPAGERGGINLFQFVRNNPVIFTDPSGAAPTNAAPGYAVDAYDLMFTHGKVWSGLKRSSENGLETMARISSKNIAALDAELDTEQQRKLAARIGDIPPEDSWLTHFSEADFTNAEGIHFKSLATLQKERGDYAYEGHSEGGNITEYANHDFVFFAWEAGGAEPSKQTSRFGQFRYHARTAELGEKAQYTYLELTDLLRPNHRDVSVNRAKSLGWLRDKDADDSGIDAFKNRVGLKENSQADIIFLGADMLKGMGHKIAADLDSLSSATQEAVVEWASYDRPLTNISELVNAFYRPQVVVPGGLKLNRSQFSLRRPKSS